MYAVRTGSMAPTYPTGTLVGDAPATSPDPAVGQVTTFQTPGGLVTVGIAGGGDVLVFFQQPTGILSLVLLAINVMFAWSLFFGAPAPRATGRLT